jgi:hypothetical protein
MVLSNHFYSLKERNSLSEHTIDFFYKFKEYYFSIGYSCILNASDASNAHSKVFMNGISGNFGFDFYRSKNNKFIIPVCLFYNYYRYKYTYGNFTNAKIAYNLRGIKIGIEYKPIKPNLFIYTCVGIMNGYRYDEYTDPSGIRHGSAYGGYAGMFDIGLKYYFGKPFGK